MLKKETPKDELQPAIEKAGPKDFPQIMRVWESSVKATHDFLSQEDFDFFKEMIPTCYLPQLDVYMLCSEEEVFAFMGISGEELEMLFVSAESRGKGYGKKLLKYAIRELDIKKVDVNEQNGQAVGFYERFGFKVAGRSAKDSTGKDYPILHMSL